MKEKKYFWLIFFGLLVLIFLGCERNIIQNENDRWAIEDPTDPDNPENPNDPVDPEDPIDPQDPDPREYYGHMIDFSNAKIAYTSQQNGNSEIYIMDIDGKSKINLTRFRSYDFHPQFSPDGSKLAYISEWEHGSQIYYIDFIKKCVIRVTNDDSDKYYFNFSADGYKIVYSTDPIEAKIKVVDIESGDVIIILQGSDASFSPDGTKIVYSKNEDIYVFELIQGQEYQLSSEIGTEYAPCFSPAGNQISYIADMQLYLMNADGTEKHKISNDIEVHYYPQFHPDGSKILFLGGILAEEDIYQINLFNLEQISLTNSPGNTNSPRYSTLGSKIVFSSDRSGFPNIYLMDSNGNNLQKLTDSTEGDIEPVFYPGDF